MLERRTQRHDIPRILVAEEQLSFGVAHIAQCECEHLTQFFYRINFEPLPGLGREVIEVGFVVLWYHDSRDTSPQGAEQLLLHTADGQDATPQGHFAGHRDVVTHLATRKRRDQRRSHRDTGTGAVLGDGAGRDVDVQVAVEHLLRNMQRRRVGLGIGPRRSCRLLHHVAELAGEHQLTLASH